MSDPASIVATAEHQARRRDPRAVQKIVTIGAVVVVAATVLFLLWLSEHQQTTALSTQVSDLNGRIGELQQAQASAAGSAQALADQVKALGKTPVVTPPEPIVGPAGAAGRGITGTSVSAGHLIVAYSDGSAADVGPVVGAAGPPGVSVVSSMLIGGRLVIGYSDGHTADVGQVVGPAGPEGAAGAPGRSVSGVANTGGHLIVAYSDGTTSDAGPLPAGPTGPAGPAGAAGAAGATGEPGRPPSGFTFSDGVFVYTCTPDSPADPGASPNYSCTRSKIGN